MEKRRAGTAKSSGPRSRYVALPLRSDTTVRRDDGGLVNARQNAIIGVGRDGSQCGWIEPLDDEPDAERRLPKGLRDRGDGCHRGNLLVEPEQDGDPRNGDQGAADEPQQ